MNDKITSYNCIEKMQELDDTEVNQRQRSMAWKLVYRFCRENGMEKVKPTSIEDVIYFLESLVKNQRHI